MKKFNKIAIIGVGLVGGSIGLAVKKKGLAKEVIGIVRRESSGEKALKFKTVDKVTLNIKEGIGGAELVIIATPVGTIIDIAKEVIKNAKNDMFLTDVGSTKEIIVKEIEKIAPSYIKFVGSHPMAGSEKSGVEYANGSLFDNAVCILTKTKNTDEKVFDAIKNFWEGLGCSLRVLSPRDHDNFIAFVSHLPHVAAVALTIAAHPDSLEYASTGFKDTTRIASSNPDLWQDIFQSNKDALSRSLYDYRMTLEGIERAIKENDTKALMEFLKKAKDIRDSIK